MDKPMIGIRQADGSFYAIMDDAHGSRKRLVLSAARTDQQGVRIELFRSETGTLDDAAPLGAISLDDPDGLGFKDIEFRLDLDEGQLEASAALPGQPPRVLSVDLAAFRDPEAEPARRSDADLLADDALASADLDTLDDAFASDAEVTTLDLPEADLADLDLEAPRRSDSEILADDLVADADLDTLEDFDLDAPSDADLEPEAKAGDDFDLDSLSLEPDPLVPDTPPAAEAFDFDDLDAGFGSQDPQPSPTPLDVEAGSGPEGEEWEKISLDDMEPMEFMDTGDEISKPRANAAPLDEFSMDDEAPLELGDLGDLDSDLSDLPDLDAGPRPPVETGDSFSLDDPGFDPDWQPDEASAPAVAETKAKAPKAPRAPKGPRPTNESESEGGLDKTALLLSLSALSLLVLLILVLLFLNMIKAPPSPVIQPEVMRWKPAVSAVVPAANPRPVADLGASAPVYEASSVLETPEDLRTVKVTLKLQPGETLADATRRFGPPARVEGNVLFW